MVAPRSRLTAFPNGVSSFGIPQIGAGVPTTFGRYWFVDSVYGSDGNSGMAPGAAWKTIEWAYSQIVAYGDSNNDDVLLVRGGSSTYNLDAMLDISINRFHMLGLDGAWRPYGQGAKIQFTGTTGATNIATMRNTGVRNSFGNLKFINGSTINESLYTVAEGGEYTQYGACEFYKSTDLDQTGAAEFVWNGDSTLMENCTVGSLADALVGAIVRPCVLLTAGIAAAGKVCRDGLMRDSRLWRNASDTGNRFMYGANATDVERTLTLEHVGFINNGASATKPAQCIAFGASLTVGNVVLDPLCYAANVTKVSTTTGVLVSGPAPNSGTGIAVNAA